MMRGTHKIAIPNPHGSDIEDGLLYRILRDAGISREEFDNIK